MSSGRTARLTGVAVPVDPLEGGVSRELPEGVVVEADRIEVRFAGAEDDRPVRWLFGSRRDGRHRPLAGGAGAVPAPLAPLRGSRRVVRRVIKARPPHLRTGRDLRAHRRRPR